VKTFSEYVVSITAAVLLTLGMVWLAGYNFDGTWDDLSWDHPTNWSSSAPDSSWSQTR
jgi:hypothetical protein